MDFVHQIEHNPDFGARLTAGHFFLALFIGILESDHVNPLVMDLAQLGAWLIAIVVGVLTSISYLKKIFSKK